MLEQKVIQKKVIVIWTVVAIDCVLDLFSEDSES